ncbi:unnamed protein product [marine sediment metagenome]|uniref:Uncharacterized protein n=1 Tax=marine sediment metagenome TaxID=412755 RepID=X1GLL1_9ZZZZ
MVTENILANEMHSKCSSPDSNLIIKPGKRRQIRAAVPQSNPTPSFNTKAGSPTFVETIGSPHAKYS